MTGSASVSRRAVLGGLTATGTLAGTSRAIVQERPASGAEIIVVGAGVFGAWTAWTLQKRGYKVLLLDAWGAAHSRASSGGALATITGTGGDMLGADRFVFACGSWMPKLFPEVIGTRIAPIHKDVFFFAPEGGDVRFARPHMPAWVDASDPDLHYGFPDIEARGFKIALDGPGQPIDPDTTDRRVGDQALADVRVYLKRRFPDLAARPLVEQRVCQYENTADRNFLIDRHPVWANTWIVGGGSGHGFKHGPAVARYVADLMAGSGKPEARFALASHQAQG